jgi:queuine tRNA-ribosyltransferase
LASIEILTAQATFLDFGNLALHLLQKIAMQFEVIAKCPTTRARVSRMTLSRECLQIFEDAKCSSNKQDGITMLPTFMPVATQAAIKGLTPEQVESLGVTLILNNTYHLNLRPGLKVLDEVGGAHKFQGWERNLLTVSRIVFGVMQ